MKKKLLVLLFTGIILSGCSTIAENSLESGKGSMELLTPTITAKDNELEIKTKGIDENKVTFIYVANKKVLEQKLKMVNPTNLTLKISNTLIGRTTNQKFNFYKRKTMMMMEK